MYLREFLLEHSISSADFKAVLADVRNFGSLVEKVLKYNEDFELNRCRNDKKAPDFKRSGASGSDWG